MKASKTTMRRALPLVVPPPPRMRNQQLEALVLQIHREHISTGDTDTLGVSIA